VSPPTPRGAVLGPEIVQRFLPVARPFVMVDRVHLFQRLPTPTLSASRLITGNEPVFDGHLPDLMLWPGVYTIEGLAQSCNLLLAFERTAAALDAEGDGEALLWETLRHARAGLRMQPTPRSKAALERLDAVQSQRIGGVLTSVDLKLTAPVFAGDELHYHVRVAGRFGEGWAVAVEASVDRRTVAKGELKVAVRSVG
jgi:3-hydroxyacyl-[acyl-carrier-protein] dehydratase